VDSSKKKGKKSMKKIVIIGILSFLLTGCGDRTELEEEAFVVVMGIDKAKEKGSIDVTYQIANPQVGSTDRSKAENEPPSEIITITAPDLSTARQMANISITRKVMLSHVKIVIVGEKLARSKKLLGVLEPATKERELRRDVVFIVSKEKAATFIRKTQSPLETRPHKYYDMMIKRWKETGFVPISTFEMYMRETAHDAGAFLATYATSFEQKTKYKTSEEDENVAGEERIKTQSNTQMLGSAIFKEGEMIGKLTGEETRIIGGIRHQGETRKTLTTYQDPIRKSFRIGAGVEVTKKPKIKVVNARPGPKIKIDVPLKVDILAVPSLINYSTNIGHSYALKKSIEHELEKEANQIAEKSQKKYKLDLFDAYSVARRHFWTMKQYEHYDWMKSYPDGDITIRYHVTLTQFGKQLKPTNLRLIRD